MNSKFYDNSIFANNLRRILAEKGMTAAELARALGVSKAAVSDWLKGKSLPRIDKVDKICIILNCKRSDFTEEPTPLEEKQDELFEKRKLLFDLSSKATEEDLDKFIKMLNVMLGEDK